MNRMTAAIILIVTLAIAISATASTADIQINSILSWTGTTSGKLIHRDIQFANATEDELQLGRNLNKHLSVFADYTQDSKDNQRLGFAVSYKENFGRNTLSANLLAWNGLGDAANRIKWSGIVSHKITNTFSLGIYALESKVNGRKSYLEYGPAILLQDKHLNLNMYPLWKNTGKRGVEFDIRYNY